VEACCCCSPLRSCDGCHDFDGVGETAAAIILDVVIDSGVGSGGRTSFGTAVLQLEMQTTRIFPLPPLPNIDRERAAWVDCDGSRIA